MTLTVQAAGRGVIDLLDAGSDPQPGLFEVAAQAAVVAIGPLLIYQQAQTFFKGQALDIGLAGLDGQRIGHGR